VGDNRKIYTSNNGNAYKGLKIRQKRQLKINTSNQANNQIQRGKCKEKIEEIYVLQCPPITSAPSVKQKLSPEIRTI
jgi:hypothetical protein